MVLTQDIQYTVTSIHGTGFIALASLVFGKWNPWGVLGAGMFFGFSQTLSYYAKDIKILASLPLEVFYALPYRITSYNVCYTKLLRTCRRRGRPRGSTCRTRATRGR